MKIEGYWSEGKNSNYPMPFVNEKPWSGKIEFLNKLVEIQKKSKIEHYKGISFCRICNIINGSREYRRKEWKWPEGFFHYIMVHNVKPTQEFIDFIMGE